MQSKRIVKITLWILGVSVCVFVGLILLGICFVTEGEMPKESVAISVRPAVLGYAADLAGNTEGRGLVCNFEPEFANLPASILELGPQSYKAYDSSGMLVVYKNVFVEGYGYFYCKNDCLPPEEVAIFCRRIAPGVYYYYNPG